MGGVGILKLVSSFGWYW